MVGCRPRGKDPIPRRWPPRQIRGNGKDAEPMGEHGERRACPLGETVDHRSYKRQGVNKIPTKHMGQAASAMEAKGIKTEIGLYNHAVYALNKANDTIFSIVNKYDNTKQQKTHTKQIEKCPDWLIVQQKQCNKR